MWQSESSKKTPDLFPRDYDTIYNVMDILSEKLLFEYRNHRELKISESQILFPALILPSCSLISIVKTDIKAVHIMAGIDHIVTNTLTIT